jgi:hypothetical protein
MAQRSACTALAKAASNPSPVVLNTRPSCVAASGSTTSARSAHARQRARFVRADHGGVADHVSCQDAGQAASHLAHAHSPMRRTPLGAAYDAGAGRTNRHRRALGPRIRVLDVSRKVQLVIR